ncbi:hypothetical protein IF2G_01978 [Cordyceps javanica]|nr:hypothetical protein IF2G_01978 [Cordyceps javanica]
MWKRQASPRRSYAGRGSAVAKKTYQPNSFRTVLGNKVQYTRLFPLTGLLQAFNAILHSIFVPGSHLSFTILCFRHHTATSTSFSRHL